MHREIEILVHEVLRRLREQDATPTAIRNGDPPSVVQDGRNTGELHILSQVVGLAELDGKLNGIDRVRVAAKAVITPAARDELRRRRIVVVKGVADESRKASLDPSVPENVQTAVLIGAAGIIHPVHLLTEWLTKNRIAFQHVDVFPSAGDGLACVVSQMCGVLNKERRLGVLLTSSMAAALCLANRHSGVRAVRGNELEQLLREVEQVGANLLIVDPLAHSQFTLRRLIRSFIAGGYHDCPAVYQQELA